MQEWERLHALHCEALSAKAALAARLAAVEFLAELAQRGRSWVSATTRSALTIALEDLDADVRRGVLDLVVVLGNEMRDAVPVLARLAHGNPDPTFRRRAFYAIDSVTHATFRTPGHVSQTERDAIAAFTAGLADGDSEVRRSAAEGLGGKSDAMTPEAVAGLTTLLADPDPDVQAAATASLRRSGN